MAADGRPSGATPERPGRTTSTLPVQRWTALPWGRVHWWYARGPAGARTVLLVHGIGAGARVHLPLAAELAEAFNVIVPDLPGYGRSDAAPTGAGLPALAAGLGAWLDAEGLDGLPVYANSIGCQVAVRLAVRAPALVERLVLQGPTLDASARGPVRQVLRLLGDVPRERPTLIALQLRGYARAGPSTVLATVRSAFADRPERALTAVPQPVLVVTGERDPIATRGWALQLAEAAPAGRALLLEDAPHGLMYSAPQRLAAAISPFLAGGAAPPR